MEKTFNIYKKYSNIDDFRKKCLDGILIKGKMFYYFSELDCNEFVVFKLATDKKCPKCQLILTIKDKIEYCSNPFCDYKIDK